ncbi:COPII-coated vesicle protein [Flagelloscypha sp. PMI_526]|nr:COPII-coated vesicle protein [Flagelloscypha sp. PMI_526]
MTFVTRISATAVLAIFLSTLFLQLASAHLIDIDAGKKECFFEDLSTNDKMTVTYQVSGGGHMDIDFWLTDPTDKVLSKKIRQSTGSVSITAEKNGRHEYCFSNQMSAIADKVVSFNVHGVIYIPEDGIIFLHSLCFRFSFSLELADIIAPIEREIRKLSQGLTAVKDEQEYMVLREKVHRNTAESTNSRVKWWSILQSIILFAVVGWQVYYLKSFFEVKRVI